MKYTRFGDRYILKLDRGEEVVQTLTEFVRKNGIKAGSVTGIGAVSDVTLGFFDPETKEYHQETLPGGYEVSNISGNAAVLNGEEMLHLHATIADSNHKTMAGHLFSARVSVTLEVIIQKFAGALERKMDEAMGLNLLDID